MAKGPPLPSPASCPTNMPQLDQAPLGHFQTEQRVWGRSYLKASLYSWAALTLPTSPRDSLSERTWNTGHTQPYSPSSLGRGGMGWGGVGQGPGRLSGYSEISQVLLGEEQRARL